MLKSANYIRAGYILAFVPPGPIPAAVPESGEEERFAYVNNPDGSVRWFFPADSANPLFLELYQRANWKSRLYHFGINTAFALGQQHRLLSGTFQFDLKQNKLALLAKEMGCSQYAVFTGTAGADRKSVVALGDDGKARYFLKIAHTESALALVQNERKALETLSDISIPGLFVPKHYPNDYTHMLAMDNAKPENAGQATELRKIHADVLQGLWATGRSTTLAEMPLWHKTGQAIESLQNPANRSEALNAILPKDFVNRLATLFASTDTTADIRVSLAHGDFTPWNMYTSPQGLHVFDWERSDELPAFFDAFHFIYQSEILLRRRGAKGIRAAVKALPALFG
ncbi:MAG: phosphotransferase, partial [Bacteroidia bacterium]